MNRGAHTHTHSHVDDVATVLRELEVCDDPSPERAAAWLSSLDEQLLIFKAQRAKEDEDDEDEDDAAKDVAASLDLRYFECLPHLLWWTLCSAVTYMNGEEQSPQQTAADSFVPAQNNFDDFLCLMPLRCYDEGEDRTAAALCNILTAYDESESVSKASFPEDDADDTKGFAEQTREKHVEVFRTLINTHHVDAVDPETSARQLELGCNLYASQIATVESMKDDLSLRRWRECYLAKCKEIAEWLTARPSQIWERANTEPDFALLVPFTKRADLFASRRQTQAIQLEAQMERAKKRFDAEHNESQIIESDFQCPKCGSFRTRSYHLQMRGADESMAQLWKCWNCKKSGKKQ